MGPEILLPSSVLNHMLNQMNPAAIITIGASRGEGLQPANPPTEKFKNTYFVGTMKSKDLRDFPFNRNQPLESAVASRYMEILKNITKPYEYVDIFFFS
jgi:hypothetical protein